MPITITLPDDVALSLMTQISGQVGRVLASRDAQHTSQRAASVRKHAPSSESRPAVMTAIEAMGTGNQFHFAALATQLGLRPPQVAPLMSILLQNGTLKRIGNGIYEKV